MDVALSTTLANLTAAVNRLQPSFVNNNRRRRDRFEEPVMAPPNGNHNRANFSSFESKEVKEELEERIDVVLQRILLSSKEESQQHSLFRSHCSVHKKVGNLVIDSRSCENLVSRKLVDYFNLPLEPHEAPYSLGWVENGSHVRVTQTCRVPIWIGKHYQEEVLCDVLDMDACHILLGRSWQGDKGVTYKSRDNVVLFHWGDRKIAMRGINSFTQKPPKKNEVSPTKVEHVVVPESQHENPKDSETTFELSKVEVVENIPEPPRPLSQEVKRIDPVSDVSVIPASKIPNQTETVPITNILIASYPYKFDEVLLIWRRSREHPAKLEGKYYLVDADIPHKSSLIAPYRGVRYHLKEYYSLAPQDARE
ncbi:hypothetical protein OSB04_011809 [Centaurea solstitialis]|uniref:Uncharacterized protein n=1 Tax=Centaurea solstitialis TaxID=347529 RepID=A0AA38WLV0_9ASTR|nr:hypothetical protein OSB04_011809 [Centaurea solstitialis]